MSEFNKYSTDGGATFIDVEDSNAVHYGDQSKGYVGKNLLNVDNAINATNVVSGVSNQGIISFKDVGITWSNSFLGYFDVVNGKTYTLSTNDLTRMPCYRLGISNTPNHFPTSAYFPNVTVQGRSLDNIMDNNSTIDIVANESTRIYLWMCTDYNTANKQAFNKGFMIRLATISDSTYEIPIPPNTDLLSYKDNGVLGAQNLHTYPFRYDTVEFGHVTFTSNSNETITLNGTASDQISYVTHSRALESNDPYPCYLPIGKYKFSVHSDKNIGKSVATTYNGQFSRIAEVTTDEYCYFEITENTQSDYKLSDGSVLVGCYLDIFKDTVLNNDVITPTITLMSDTDEIIRKHALTNRRLTDKVFIKTSNITSAINTALTDQSFTNVTVSQSSMSVSEDITRFSIWFSRVDTTNAINNNIELSSVFPYKAAQWVGGTIGVRDGDVAGLWWIDKDSTMLRIRLPQGLKEFIVSGYIPRI